MKDPKEEAIFYGGLAVGSIMGIFGTIFYQYAYDTSANTPIFLIFVSVSGIAFFLLMAFMVLKVRNAANRVTKQRSHKQIDYRRNMLKCLRTYRVVEKTQVTVQRRKSKVVEAGAD